MTGALIRVSGFFVNNAVILLLAALAASVSVRYFIKSASGRYLFDGLKLKIPGMKNVCIKIITARFARSMGILLKSGVPIIGAVDIMKHMIGNKVVERRFEQCGKSIREGRGIAGPVAELEIFPKLLIHMISVGEKSGELDEMLERTAGFFDAEVEESIDRLTVMIEPLMILILGAVVGVIIVAVMLPMISVMTAI